jgi:hypothetical protein
LIYLNALGLFLLYFIVGLIFSFINVNNSLYFLFFIFNDFLHFFTQFWFELVESWRLVDLFIYLEFVHCREELLCARDDGVALAILYFSLKHFLVHVIMWSKGHRGIVCLVYVGAPRQRIYYLQVKWILWETLTFAYLSGWVLFHIRNPYQVRFKHSGNFDALLLAEKILVRSFPIDWQAFIRSSHIGWDLKVILLGLWVILDCQSWQFRSGHCLSRLNVIDRFVKEFIYYYLTWVVLELVQLLVHAAEIRSRRGRLDCSLLLV